VLSDQALKLAAALKGRVEFCRRSRFVGSPPLSRWETHLRSSRIRGPRTPSRSRVRGAASPARAAPRTKGEGRQSRAPPPGHARTPAENRSTPVSGGGGSGPATFTPFVRTLMVLTKGDAELGLALWPRSRRFSWLPRRNTGLGIGPPARSPCASSSAPK